MALVGLAATVLPEASAQLQSPVYPAWTALISAELAKEKNLPEPSAELRACFDAHRAALLKKPEAVFPLLTDFLGADPVRRDCAMAAEVDLLINRYRVSSPINDYAPLISSMSKQNGSLARKTDLERCQGKQFIFDAAATLNGMAGGMIPKHAYSWVKPAADAPCVAASQ